MTTPSPSARSAFWRGFREAMPFILIVAPFGVVFGVVAIEAGFTVTQAIAFSMSTYAGAAQLTAIQLLSEGAPVAIVVLTALAVNARMAMYSASLAPHLGKAPIAHRALLGYLMVDQTFALSAMEYERIPQMSLAAKTAYYLGIAAFIWPIWMLGSVAGAILGNLIPDWVPLGFAVPIAFMAMIGPMLRTLAHVAAALVSVIGALIFSPVPYSLGLLIAAILAMITGALIETWTLNRRARQ
ncbi:AzlC family ABC transporter permease [Pararhodobacter sp.]|uniref:AzlC family ABC transporter permease n=1 Tax=Pararhodobacter sp. TaxID=2127056 RepID=UPI002AFEE8CC|nr:AzlC family ABC transporter permease [Pararhodobacter sp.]